MGVSKKEDNEENNNGDKEEDKNKTEQEWIRKRKQGHEKKQVMWIDTKGK